LRIIIIHEMQIPHEAIILYYGSFQEVFAKKNVHHGVIDPLVMKFGNGQLPKPRHDIPSCALVYWKSIPGGGKLKWSTFSQC
jgi:hypothetical protein